MILALKAAAKQTVGKEEFFLPFKVKDAHAANILNLFFLIY
jgi:hypothetical protein